MPTRAVDRPERGDVGSDLVAAGHAGEEPAFGVHDRSAGTDEINGPVRLSGRDCRVRAPVQDLNRPRAQREHADADTDERCEAADAQEEAGAAEERRVRTRVRLQAAAAGKRARELRPAPAGIGGRDRYGVYGWSIDVGFPV
jgi:hypothetical protein